MQRSLQIETRGKGLYDISAQVQKLIADSGVKSGLCTLFIQHTSASLLIQENASVDVQHDLERWFTRLVVDGDPIFRHTEEGPDDMTAHVRSALTQTSIGIPVVEGRAALGTWQAIYVWEHRIAPYTRRVLLTLIGD
ncbi:MAG TPA: secondary thiamine-phosphate synthase enzyme YjbQ [Polyangiales bacterium]|nr:secondary thiamine-phosphate synthase enzyme YjbQ [Polyangiales bacterium]